MKVLIIEDEMLAASRIQLLLKQYDPSIKVVACIDSIEETVEWFNTHAHPDLILADIQLSDGYSFEIFKKVQVNKPVIFTTAFDQYAIEAFKVFSIDYILKPVTQASLAAAINKYKSLSGTITHSDYSKLSFHTRALQENQYKKRFLAKVGQRLFFVETDAIAYFQADNKIVYLVDITGNRYVIDYTLEKLEELLDPKEFFRLNRRFIVKVSAIEHIKPFYNSRLKLSVKGHLPNEEMIISRERVADFKSWAES